MSTVLPIIIILLYPFPFTARQHLNLSISQRALPTTPRAAPTLIPKRQVLCAAKTFVLLRCTQGPAPAEHAKKPSPAPLLLLLQLLLRRARPD